MQLDIFYGETPPEWAARNDTEGEVIGTQLPTRFIKLGNRSVGLKRTSPVVHRGPYDGIIFEQAVRNLETYPLLVRGRRLALRRAYWGHGRTYTAHRSSLEERLKFKLTRHSDWFFGYTDAGVQHMVAKGFPEDRTTVVRNSMDSEKFVESLRNIRPEDLETFRDYHDLQGRTALYIGGLDRAKRLDFLVASGDLAHSRDPLFRLLVVGDGSQSDWLRKRGESRDWLKLLGSSTGKLKCLAFRSAQVLAVPGRVGLVAVDSLAAGVPLVTTNWPFHAPEFEYLETGRTCQVSGDTIGEFSEMLLATLRDRELVSRMSQECLSDAQKYTVHTMASNFASGVRAFLDVR